jgi:hypothetical protein
VIGPTQKSLPDNKKQPQRKENPAAGGVFSRGFTAPPPPPVGLGLLIEFPRSPSDTPHSVDLLWTRGRPFAETST